jgi:pimeloyl-ACP methyl ester carboxylesterase
MRPDEWAHPPVPVRREVISTRAADDRGFPPVLFVPGYGQAAWVFAEHWVELAAERGFPAYAMSLRNHGGSGAARDARLRDYVHDVTQVASRLPTQAVLIGHGAGALVVAMAMARYPARAGVLVSPVFGGVATALTALRRNATGTLAGLFGGAVRLRRGQLFSRELPAEVAQQYVNRLDELSGRASRASQWQLVRRREPEAPVGNPPVLVVGSPDDRVVSRTALERVARRYGGAPLLFPGMGHEVMLDARWREPIEAILDWLEKAP